jgi:serine/threonine protein kinase/tetratricopeptide (TPR) repeat protein
MQVGSYNLVEIVGSGAMGQVWRGRDDRRGLDVAVKFASFMNEARSREALTREIEAVASLHHPGIVDIYDIGECLVETAAKSNSRLAPGTPWFAMTYAPGASLVDHKLGSWADIRHVALQVLDALAHAHARGVVHRDLKPGNILVLRAGFHGPEVALTDFGIAHVAFDRGGDLLDAGRTTRTNERVSSAGTPIYMSPEQFRADWRALGPWTDVYALGCMVYAWVTGEVPFTASSLTRLAYRHCSEPFPALGPTAIAYPDELDGWLQRACAKQPRDRFSSAADAAHALLRLGPPMPSKFPRPGVEPPVNDQRPGSNDWASTTLPLAAFELAAASEAEETSELEVFAPPNLPPDWRRVEAPATTLAGLGLFGLRALPFVDREPARDLLWSSLRETAKTGKPRGVVVRGLAGRGKSRVVRWMSERAHETAGVETLAAFHGPGGSPLALTNMILDHCNGHDLDREQLCNRFAARYPRLNEDSMSRLADLAVDPTLRAVMPALERNLLLERVLSSRADDRPVIVWLDDAIWGDDAMSLAEHLLQEGMNAPVLVVLTVRDEAVDDAPEAAARIARLESRDSVGSIRLDALSRRDQRELVGKMVGLTGELAARVVECTSGNPLFAVQLVGDLVQREQLEATPMGVDLVADALPMPATMQALWSRRIDEVLEAFAGERDVLQMLVVAAALGERVVQSEWEDVLERIGLGSPAGIVDALVRRRLARRLEAGWRFSHGLLRECLEDKARSDGRWIAANAACAAWLAAQEPAGPLDHWRLARLGRFRVQANDEIGGFEALFEASWHAVHAEEMSLAVALVDDARVLADSIELAEHDERRGLLHVRRLLAQRYKIPLEKTVERARNLVVEAAKKGWPSVEAEARMLIGTRLAGMGQHDEALEHQRAAKTLLEEAGEESRALHAAGLMAYTMWFSNRREEALALQHEVATRRQAIGDLSAMASDMDKLGFMYADSDPERARQYYLRGVELSQQLGRRELQAHIVDGLGRVAEKLGDYDEAKARFREAARLFDLVGSPAASMARYHGAHIRLMHERDVDGALELLDRVISVFDAFGVPMYVASASAAQAVAHARAGRLKLAHAALDKMESAWSDKKVLPDRRFVEFLSELVEGADEGLATRAEEFLRFHGVMS